MMNPKNITKEEIFFLGVEQKFTNDTDDPGYENLWFKKFMPKENNFKNFRINDCYYALVLNNDDKSWIYMPAVQIEEKKIEIPEGMITRKIPSSKYLVFETTVANIGETWDQVTDWLKVDNSNIQKETSYSFEYYPPNTTKQESPVFIYIPVK